MSAEQVPKESLLAASAGNHGPDVRLDCRVTVRAGGRQSGQVSIQSKVGLFYQESIESLVRAGLEALNASDLSVEVEDSGALPYTLLARLEAAVRRLRPDLPASRMLLPEKPPQAGLSSALPGRNPSLRSRLRRSRLYLPGNTPKYFINAGLYGPDTIVLDLEDSVAPQEKDAARLLVRAALVAVDFYSAEKSVRINGLPDGLDDMRLLAHHGVHTFLVPKVESPEQVRQAAALLDELSAAGRLPNQVWLIPILESASGMFRAAEIAQASPRNAALAIGIEDYLRDLGARKTQAGLESLWARSQVVNAARAAGIQPLASVYANVEDGGSFASEAGLLAFASAARDFGFEGIGCLHPRQVRGAHQAFTPSPAEIETAGRVAAAYQAALAGGSGVASVDGTMVDKPVAERAVQTLRLARAAGVLPAGMSALVEAAV